MSTRFETKDGVKLGAKFAGDQGRTFHFTSEEEKALWTLSEDTEIISDDSWQGTVGELIDLLKTGARCTEEELTIKE